MCVCGYLMIFGKCCFHTHHESICNFLTLALNGDTRVPACQVPVWACVRVVWACVTHLLVLATKPRMDLFCPEAES